MRLVYKWIIVHKIPVPKCVTLAMNLVSVRTLHTCGHLSLLYGRHIGKLPHVRCTSICSSTKVKIIPIAEPVQHAEGPFYDQANEYLYYVDTFKATAFRFHLKTAKRTSYKLEGHDSIGVIILNQEEQDEFVVATDRCLYRMTWRDCANAKPNLEELLMVEPDKPFNQFNDGKVDNRGRLWLGTLTRNEDLTVAPKGGSLYMFKSDDLKNYEEKIPNTSISNGLAWSKDGKRFYFVDSMPRLVYGYDFDENTGRISNESIVFDLKNHSNLKGIPDGMAIDVKDNLWIALFGGKAIINVDPKTSKILRVVKMPVTYITSVCFGGAKLNELFVTTSRLHLNEDQVKEEPLAGSVFTITNLGIGGLLNKGFNVSC